MQYGARLHSPEYMHCRLSEMTDRARIGWILSKEVACHPFQSKIAKEENHCTDHYLPFLSWGQIMALRGVYSS